MPMGKVGQARDVGYGCGRIGHGLGEDGPGVVLDQGFHLIKVVDVVHEIRLNTEVGEEGLHGIHGGPIEVDRGDQPPTAFGCTHEG